MQVMAVKCPSCGGQVNVPHGQRMTRCQYCGANVIVDDGVQRVEQHVTYDNAEEAGYSFEKGRQRAQQEAMRGMSPQVPTRPIASMPQAVSQPPAKKKMGKGELVLWVIGWVLFFPIPLAILIVRAVKGDDAPSAGTIALWTLGWLLVFPVPLTILMRRKQGISPAVRTAVIVLGWAAYLGLMVFSMATGPKRQSGSQGDGTRTEQVSSKSERPKAEDTKG